MSRKSWHLSRRTLLRGIGASMALPLLEVMEPLSARAAVIGGGREALKVGYLYFPNGVAKGSWQPKRVGDDGSLLELSPWMKPLEAYKEDLLIPENIWTPRGNGHGAGTATWLTGGRYDGKRIDAGGMSVDQIAATHLGVDSPIPSLELSTQGEGYFSNDLPRNTISWTASNTPASRETVPRIIFDRLFRRSNEGMTDRSVLDLVLGQANTLKTRVSEADKRKIDEYLESVRAVEKRIEFADRQTERAANEGTLTDTLRRPETGIPSNHQEYVREMLDLMVLGFWSGATRISSFMLDHGQSNRYFNFIDGVEGTWHALSHYRDISGRTEDDDGKTSWKSRDSKRSMYCAVNQWHHEQVAYLLGRLKELKDGEGSLLDNTMLVYGSSLSDGHTHGESDIPVLLAGRGSGALKPGRQLGFKRPTSLSNLHLYTLQQLGVPVEEFADSDTPMTEVAG
ncbi:MAG: DUF1552 domain-containing protein [Verrucomicrobiota bacterium]